MADQISLDIGKGMIERIAHPRLRCEVNRAPDRAFPQFGGDLLVIRDIEAHELEIGMVDELRETRLLEADVVVIVEIVDADDGIAAAQKPLGKVKADETGGACHEIAH